MILYRSFIPEYAIPVISSLKVVRKKYYRTVPVLYFRIYNLYYVSAQVTITYLINYMYYSYNAIDKIIL